MSGPATRRQIGRVHASLAALGITDRAEKLRTVAAVIYRPIKSSNDLTFKEAHIVIDMLDHIAAHEAPATALASMVAAAEQRIGVTR